MFRVFVALACAVHLGAGQAALAQANPSPPSLAEPTAAQIAARDLLAALNGSADQRSAFASAAFSSRALESESAASRLAWLNQIAGQSGGFSLISATTQGDRMVEAIVRSDRGGKFGKLVVFTAKTEAGKVAQVFLLPARDPAKAKAESWPTGALSKQAIAAAIGKRVKALAAEDLFSGVVLVAKGDEVIFKQAYGFADQTWRIPNRTDTALHVGSIGKMFTAAAIMQLARDGKIALDDKLARLVPEYPHPEASVITLRQLLTHSAGIGEWENRASRKPMSGAQAAATMTKPHQFAPGERFAYSNAGYTLLGAVIEKATGKPLAEALQELVFLPARMKGTGLWPVTSVIPNRATGYLHKEDDPLGLGPRYSNEQFLGYAADGSGGEYSTVEDLLAFLSAVANGKLLGREATAEMLAPRIDFSGAALPMKYGYGVNRGTCAGKAMFGHEGGGANSGVSSLAFRLIDSGWTVIVLSNYDPPFAGELTMSICEFVARR